MNLKLVILSVLLLLFSSRNIKYAFSSKNACTNLEGMDEKEKSISLAINNIDVQNHDLSYCSHYYNCNFHILFYKQSQYYCNN